MLKQGFLEARVEGDTDTELTFYKDPKTNSELGR